MTSIALQLPLPPSVNRIWRMTPGGMVLAKTYEAWKRECDGILMADRGWRSLCPILGDVEVVLEIDEELRARAGDLDNRIKAALDYLQRAGVVKNDKQVRRIVMAWAPVSVPCVITVRSADRADGVSPTHTVLFR